MTPPMTRDERRAASRPLATELGMLPLYPAELPAVLEELAEGFLDWRSYPSASESGKSYLMAQSAGGWQHFDQGCRGWLIRGECRHVRSMNLESTALVPVNNSNVLALIDDLEDEEIVKSIQGELTEVWVYEFPMNGKTITGVSAKGVENGCRELAKKGEAIREMDVKIEYEDADEARFVAQAGRYAISGDGREQLLDVAIRAKRQPKRMRRRDGSMEFDDNWYEKGVTKAARNAKLALMPESAVAFIIAEAKKVGKHKQLPNAPQSNRRQVQAPANVDRETGEITEAPADLPQGKYDDTIGTFWKITRDELGITRDEVMAECEKRYPGREPMALKPNQELSALLAALRAMKATEPKQAALPT